MPTYCLYARHKLDVGIMYVMHTLRHVSINVCEIQQVRLCTLNKLEILIRYEHTTVRWYTLSYGEGVQKVVHAYRLDIS